MKKEKCAQGNHQWSCMQASGTFNELEKFRSLTPNQIRIVASDPDRANEVCPGGHILCMRCKSGFPSANSITGRMDIGLKISDLKSSMTNKMDDPKG